MAKYKIGTGPFLMVPFLPYSLRSFTGSVVDTALILFGNYSLTLINMMIKDMQSRAIDVINNREKY